MDHKPHIFTFFTFLLFTVSAARLTVDPPTIIPSAIRLQDASAGSTILLPRQKIKSDFDANNRLPEKERRTNFSTFHPINRHLNNKAPRWPKPIRTHRRPCRKHVRQYRIPRSEIPDRSDDSKSETFRGGVPSNWLKIKHHYDSRHHRNNNKNVIKPKHVLNREKLNSLIRQHKQKKREEEVGLMKSIRKFLKHKVDL